MDNTTEMELNHNDEKDYTKQDSLSSHENTEFREGMTAALRIADKNDSIPEPGLIRGNLFN